MLQNEKWVYFRVDVAALLFFDNVIEEVKQPELVRFFLLANVLRRNILIG